MLLQAITTNVKLKLYKIRENDLCSFCKDKKETLKHLFYDCKYVKVLWEFIKELLNIVQIDYKDILSNLIVPNPNLKENTVVLYTKYFIYRNRCLQESISVSALKGYINSWIETEKQIAIEKGKKPKHEQKWENFVV